MAYADVERPLTAPREPSLREAVASARLDYRAGGPAILDVLLRTPGCDASTLADRLQVEAGVGVFDPGREAQADFSVIDQPTARAWRCAVVSREGGAPLLVAEDPWDDALLRRASRRLGAQATPAAATRAAIDRLVGTGGVAMVDETTWSQASPADSPVVAFVDAAIHAALQYGASDIHFECDRSGVTVKHRLDGVIRRHGRLDGQQSAQEVVSRIKVLAQLDITECRLPQDGRFRFTRTNDSTDLRVSIMPSAFGEDAVLRLLDKAQLRSRSSAVSLDVLGFQEGNAALIRDLAREPSGMLLVTGPTGSGKTTTLYAVLTEINTGAEKIITIEDPVEYELPGVLQIPVNERKGLTFARGLRSILRHDPDRILVGEIRDAETAEIAVQSSLTGHLVFTSVHANGITDVIGRFRHFGLDMFGFMSSLNGVVVQRLVRRLCEKCASERSPTARERDWLAMAGQAGDQGVLQAIGCVDCGATGYRGRFVVAEVHRVDDALRDHVTQGVPVSALRRHAVERGVESLSMQAAWHVVRGHTTFEEVKRVVGWL